jgi:hypothetical protein
VGFTVFFGSIGEFVNLAAEAIKLWLQLHEYQMFCVRADVFSYPT